MHRLYGCNVVRLALCTCGKHKRGGEGGGSRDALNADTEQGSGKMCCTTLASMRIPICSAHGKDRFHLNGLRVLECFD